MKNYLKNLIKALFWWVFMVFAVSLIIEVFSLWVVSVLFALAAGSTVMAVVWTKKKMDKGVVTASIVLILTLLAFIMVADLAAFIHLGWLQGMMFTLITSAGAGCAINDFMEFTEPTVV